MASRKFLVPLSLVTLAEDPSSAVIGDLYFNTFSNTIRFYNGSSWIDLKENVEDIVANVLNGITTIDKGISVTYDDTNSSITLDPDDFVITLTGGVTGSGTVVDLSNMTMSTTVTNNSHSHTSSNISDFAEAVQDSAALMITNGTHTNISVSYNDETNTLNFVASPAYNDEMARDAVATMITSATHSNISVAYDDENNTLAFTAGATYTDEMAQDATASLLNHSDHNNITVTYNDAANKIVLSVPPGTTVSATAPASPDLGETWFDNVNGSLYVYDGDFWVEPGNVISSTDYLLEGSANLYYTNERAMDAIATAISSGTHSNVSISYNDELNSFSFSTTGDITSIDSIKYPDYITFDTSPEITPTEIGSMYWDSGDGLPATVLSENVTIGLGQEQVALVKNATGASIAKGKVVYINGAQGQRPTITLSDADTETTSSKTFGLTAEAIADGEEGFVTTFGVLRGVNTLGLTQGAPLWLSSTAGGYTTSVPAEPAHSVFIGYVVKAHQTAGEIFVNVQNGYELTELHGVEIDNEVFDNEVLAFDSASGLWKNQTSIEAGLLDTSATEQTKIGNLIISGNLTVGGTTTTFNTETVLIEDNIITLNSSVTGTPDSNSGVEIERGTSSNTSLIWNETSDKWTLTNNGTDFYPIATQNGWVYNSGIIIQSTDAVSSGSITIQGYNNRVTVDSAVGVEVLSEDGTWIFKNDGDLKFPDNSLQSTAFLGIASYDTDDISEGTRLYFTDERAQDAIGNSVGTGLSYNDTTGAVSNSGVLDVIGTTNEIVITGTNAQLQVGIPDSPVFVTPNIGVATATSVNGTTIPSSKTLVVTTDIGTSVQAYSSTLAGINTLGSGTGFLKNTAGTWSYDNSTYLTTGNASTTYAPIGSPTFTGTVTVPTLNLTNALAISYGGTGATTASDAATALGLGISSTPTFAGLTINSSNANAIAVLVKGASGQNSNLQSWRSSSNIELAAVAADGRLYTPAIYGGAGNTGLLRFDISAQNPIVAASLVTTSVSFVAKSRNSQTADIQQWQNSSSTVLAKVDVSGNLTAASIIKSGGTSSQFLKADGSIDSSTYLTSESDPIFAASEAYSITSTDTSNWDTSYGWGDHSIVGYLTSESDTLETVTDRGATSSNAITISNTTQSTTPTTGALIISGGVGIAKDVWIDGDLHVNGTTVTENTQTVATHDNLIYLNAAQDTTITNAVGDGTYVTYTAENNYTTGMDISVTGMNPSGYNIASADGLTVYSATSTQFVVAKTTTGTFVSGGTAHAKEEANPDLGFAGGYYSAGYAHAGLFRDASDGIFKFFDGYTPEPDEAVNIDTTHASFALADISANDATFTGNVSGTWNGTTIGYTKGGTGISSVSGQAGKVLAVKSDETGYEFISAGGSSGGISLEDARDEIASLIAAGTNTGITVTYVDDTVNRGSLSIANAGVLTVNGDAGAITNVAKTTDKLSAFASTTSSELATVISDETGTGSLVFSSSPALTTPDLGTPSAITLTNATGLPVATGIDGLASGIATFLATPSSANLISAVTDETGTGSLVFSTSPSLITPNIGVATATSININSKSLTQTFTGTGNAIAQNIDTAIDETIYIGAEYLVGVTTSTGRYLSKVLLISDGTNAVKITEYGILTIGTAPAVTVAAGGSASAPQLSVNAPSSSTITLVRTLVAL